MERCTVISADCHAGGSMEMYRDHLDPAYLDELERRRGAYDNPFRDLQRGGRRRNSALRVGDRTGRIAQRPRLIRVLGRR
jgi:hypothetical protein